MNVKSISTLATAVVALTIVAGCAVAPAQRVGVRTPESSATYAANEDDAVPPAEFIEGGAPVYYESDPGIAFYPLYLGYPGSCFCIMPVRRYEGVWYSPGSIVIHRGNLPLLVARDDTRKAWRSSGGVVRGLVPVVGTLERGSGNRIRAVAPAVELHKRASTVQSSRSASPSYQQRSPAADPGMSQTRPQAVQPTHHTPLVQPTQHTQPATPGRPTSSSPPKQTPERRVEPKQEPRSTPKPAPKKCSDEDHKAKKC